MFWTRYLVDCLPPLYLLIVFFFSWRFLLLFYLEHCFWYPDFACFSVVGRFAVPTSGGRVVLCSRCSVGPSGQSSGSQEWGAPAVGVMWAPPCIWVLVAVGTPVGWNDLQAYWLWGSALPAVHGLLCGADLMKQSLPRQGLVPAKVTTNFKRI